MFVGWKWWFQDDYAIDGQNPALLVNEPNDLSIRSRTFHPGFLSKLHQSVFVGKNLSISYPFCSGENRMLAKGLFYSQGVTKKHMFMGQDDLPEFKNVPKKILIIYRFNSERFSSQIPQPASMFLHSFRGFSAVIRNMICSKAVVTSKCPEDHWKLLSSKVASFHYFRKLIFVNPIFEREAINHDKSVWTLLGHLRKGRI